MVAFFPPHTDSMQFFPSVYTSSFTQLYLSSTFSDSAELSCSPKSSPFTISFLRHVITHHLFSPYTIFFCFFLPTPSLLTVLYLYTSPFHSDLTCFLLLMHVTHLSIFPETGSFFLTHFLLRLHLFPYRRCNSFHSSLTS